jgi:hypothetical protein
MLRTSIGAAVDCDRDYTLGYTDAEHERLI